MVAFGIGIAAAASMRECCARSRKIESSPFSHCSRSFFFLVFLCLSVVSTYILIHGDIKGRHYGSSS